LGAKEGDDEFDIFVRAQRDRLVGQAYLLVGDFHGAQDLTQRVLERAWRHWRKVRLYERPDAWARRVLFNMVLNERRRWGREEPLGDVDPMDPTISEDHLAVVEALRTLPPAQRKALVLHDAVGLTVAEIAAELGSPEGTVKSWLSRARIQVAKELRNDRIEESGGPR
jgi:RNA polymerase sigma-70 factor (ECF subfamily)